MTDGWIPETPRQKAGDAIARCLEPEAWAEYDEGGGVCTNGAGIRCMRSIEHAAALMNRWPGIVDVVLAERNPT